MQQVIDYITRVIASIGGLVVIRTVISYFLDREINRRK